MIGAVAGRCGQDDREFLPVADADELEGALIRIVVYADLTNQPISESLAIEAMDPGRTRP